jgi:hypothetical protein
MSIQTEPLFEELKWLQIRRNFSNEQLLIDSSEKTGNAGTNIYDYARSTDGKKVFDTLSHTWLI